MADGITPVVFCFPPILSMQERLPLCIKGLEMASENSPLLYSSLWTSAKHEISPQGDIFSAGWCFSNDREFDQEDLVCKCAAYQIFDRSTWMAHILWPPGREKLCSSCLDLGWNLICLFPNAWSLLWAGSGLVPLLNYQNHGVSRIWSRSPRVPSGPKCRESHSQLWTT